MIDIRITISFGPGTTPVVFEGYDETQLIAAGAEVMSLGLRQGMGTSLSVECQDDEVRARIYRTLFKATDEAVAGGTRHTVH